MSHDIRIEPAPPLVTPKCVPYKLSDNKKKDQKLIFAKKPFIVKKFKKNFKRQ